MDNEMDNIMQVISMPFHTIMANAVISMLECQKARLSLQECLYILACKISTTRIGDKVVFGDWVADAPADAKAATIFDMVFTHKTTGDVCYCKQYIYFEKWA